MKIDTGQFEWQPNCIREDLGLHRGKYISSYSYRARANTCGSSLWSGWHASLNASLLAFSGMPQLELFSKICKILFLLFQGENLFYYTTVWLRSFSFWIFPANLNGVREMAKFSIVIVTIHSKGLMLLPVQLSQMGWIDLCTITCASQEKRADSLYQEGLQGILCAMA